MLPQHAARQPLGYVELLHDVIDAAATTARAQKFPEAASRRISFSSVGFGDRFAQPLVLLLEFLQPLHLVGLQPAKLLAPAVVGERRHAGLWKATDAQKSALVASTMTRTNRYYSGPQSDHFDGLRFHSPVEPPAKGLLELAWMLAGKARRRWPPLATVPAQDVPPERTEHLRLSSAGHSSILVQVANLNLLIDPVWARRVSPLQFRRTEASARGGDRFRRPSTDRRCADHAQPLRPPRWRNACAPLAKVPAEDRRAAGKRCDHPTVRSRYQRGDL